MSIVAPCTNCIAGSCALHGTVLTVMPAVDIINAPPHYHDLRPHEPIDVIEHWRLSYFLGNVVKYIARHQRKGRPLEDLRKAQVYLSREIARLEKGDG